jgi:hypothetical protein
VLSGLTWVGLGDGTDGAGRCALRWHSGDAVGDSRDIGCQNVSGGKRCAVVGLATLGEDRRAVRHEYSLCLGYRESACRVDDGGLIARNDSSCGSCRLAAMLARRHGNDTRSDASRGVSTASVSDRTCSGCSVCCCGLRVILGRDGVACSVRVNMRRLFASRVRRLAVRSSRVDRWLAVRPTVWSSRVDRRLAVFPAVRCGRVDMRLAVRFAVGCCWIDRWLAPARARRC